MATYLLDHGDNSSPLLDSDRWVGHLFQFAKNLRACRDRGVGLDVLSAPPFLVEAYNIYSSPRALERTLVEAWILTGLPSTEIAEKTSKPAEVVELYETVFFQVRDRLDSLYVEHMVLKLFPSPEPTLDNVLKAYARRGGPFVLEALIRQLAMPSRSACQGGDVLQFFREECESEENLLVRLSVGLWVMEITPKNVAKRLRLLMRMRRAYKSSSATPDADKLRKFAAGLQKYVGGMRARH